MCVQGLGAARLPVQQAAGGGDFSSCPGVNHPVPGSGGSRGCTGERGTSPWWGELCWNSRAVALPSPLVTGTTVNCFGLSASGFVLIGFLGWFVVFFFSFFVIGPAQNRITRLVFVTFQIIYTLFLVLTLCMKGCVTAALVFPCDTEAYCFSRFITNKWKEFDSLSFSFSLLVPMSQTGSVSSKFLSGEENYRSSLKCGSV